MSNPNQDIQKICAYLGELTRTIVRTRQQVYTLKALEALRGAGRAPQLPPEFKSQHGEDLIIWDLLGGQLDGFFVEAGAFDGYHYSVTYALEAVGWTGLLVEPLAEQAKLCAQRRPRSRVVHSALGRDPSGMTAFTVVDDQYGGMLSHVQGMGLVANPAETVMRSESVPLTNLNTLLQDHHGPIDVMVLDVEGAEFEVLAGFDLARYRPRLLMIETDRQRGSAQLLQYMQSFPYRRIGNIESSQLFLHNHETQVLERIRWMNL